MKTEFKKGLKQGFSIPGFAMGSAMIGFGALAYESNLDYFVTIASMLFLWSMPGMILFVTLISSGASIILMFMSIFLANIRTLFIVLSAFLTMNVASQKNSFLNKLSYIFSSFILSFSSNLLMSKENSFSQQIGISNFLF